MKLKLGLIVPLLWMVSGVAPSQEVDDLSGTINEFRNIQAVTPYFESAYGYAVWPHIGRGGFGIGGATGKGQVYRSGEVTGVTRLIDVTIGFQVGGQAYKQIVFFEDERAYDDFTSGDFEFDAAASAVAVTASVQANASTQGGQASAGSGGAASTAVAAGYRGGMQVFTMSLGGLMYQATIGGQKYNFTQIE